MLLKSCYGMWRNCLQKPAWKNASSMKKVPIPSLIFISNNNRLIYSLNRDKLFQLDKSLTYRLNVHSLKENSRMIILPGCFFTAVSPLQPRKLRPMLSKPEIVVSFRTKSYKGHGNNLTSELIPASLSLNCFSDLGELCWKKIAHFFRKQARESSYTSHSELPKQSGADWYTLCTQKDLDQDLNCMLCCLRPQGSVWVPDAPSRAQPCAWHMAEIQHLLNKQSNSNSEDLSHDY